MFSKFYQPQSVEEAVALRWREPRSAYLGGGTILNTLSYAQEVPASEQAQTVISLESVGLGGISAEEEGLRIGAGTTLQELCESPLVCPALKEATGMVVNRNIRNIATVGGNLALRASTCNVAAMLLALEAEVEVALEGGQRKRQPLEEYLTQGLPQWLLTAVWVPQHSAQMGWGARRYVRTQNDISILLAYAVAAGSAQRIDEVRLVMGGVGPQSMRLRQLEDELKGGALPARDQLVEMVRPYLHPLSDLRGSAPFKREVGAQIGAWAIYRALGQL